MKLNWKILSFVLVIALLALPVTADVDEKEPVWVEIGEAITLVIVLVAAILLFMLSGMLKGDLKKGITLLAIALLIYGVVRETLELIAEFLINGTELYAEITEVVGGIILLIASISLYRAISKFRAEKRTEKEVK